MTILNEVQLNALVEPVETADPAAGGSRVLFDAPAMQLATSSPHLVFDYLDFGFRLVSVRLREVLGLAEHDVQYLDVDTSRCPPCVRAMDYRWLHLTHVSDPFDHERSTGEMTDMRFGPVETWFSMPPVQRWRLTMPGPSQPIHVRWRDDFIAPAPLFQVAGVPWTLATDALAQRIKASGIIDVALRDVTRDEPSA